MGNETGVARRMADSVARQLLGIVVAMSMLAAATVYLPAPIVHRMLISDLEQQAALWRDRIVMNLSLKERTFVVQSVSPLDRKFLEAAVKVSEIYRLKLIGRDGNIFWATNPADVGMLHPDTDHGTALLAGDIVVSIDSERARAVGLDDSAAHSGRSGAAGIASVAKEMLAEIDAPIPLPGGFARIEMFVDLTLARSIFIARVSGMMVSVAVVVGAAWTVLLMMNVRNNRRRLRDLTAKSAAEKARLQDQLTFARDIRLLGELNEWLQSSRSLEELFQMVSRFMAHLLPDCEGSIYVYSNSRDVLDGSAAWNDGHCKAHIHPDECWGLRRGRTYSYGANEIDFVCAHTEPQDGRPYLCFPIQAHGETVGLMNLRARLGVSAETFAEGRKLAQMCAEQISLAIANVRMRDELRDQSVRDPLTGLFNRRHLTDALRKHIARVQKGGASLAVISIDVDHFKRFNDNHGHDAGDMVLRSVGSVLAQHVDGDEIACRTGGEELMLLLPGADRDTAVLRAEQLCEAVAGISVRYGEKTLPRITVSVGVAVAPDHGLVPQDLIRIADDALYAAKAAGRNQVVVAGRIDSGAPENPQGADHSPTDETRATIPLCGENGKKRFAAE